MMAQSSALPLRALAVFLSVLLSLVALAVVDGDRRPLAPLRRRLLLGVPWGSLLTAAGVLAVYLVLQGGYAHSKTPLVLPFRAWSYHYPLGMLAAGFSHAGQGHLIGNLLGTVVFGSIAEYAWGHYPQGRGDQSFASVREHPVARILAVPLAAVALGLFTAAFTLGPVIGFSGVVFALAGFGVVQRPILVALGLLGNRILDVVVSAALNPQFVSSAGSRVITPWWAQVAIQGHAIGIVAGILVGVALASARDDWPRVGHVWYAVVAFAVAKGLWAVFAPVGGGRYVLFRWIGVVVVFLVAAVVVMTVAGRDDAHSLPVPSLDGGTVAVHVGTVAAMLLVVFLGSMAGAGALYNAPNFGAADAPEPSLEVRDYRVGYAEGVPNEYVGGVPVPLGDPPRVETSGVIVTSERRGLWRVVLPANALANRGQGRVPLGGVGWRTTLSVDRTGWDVAGNGSVYSVSLAADGERVRAFTSPALRADPVVAGAIVTVVPTDEAFALAVSRSGERRGRAAIPEANETTSAGGLTFTRRGRAVYATAGETRVSVARKSD